MSPVFDVLTTVAFVTCLLLVAGGDVRIHTLHVAVGTTPPQLRTKDFPPQVAINGTYVSWTRFVVSSTCEYGIIQRVQLVDRLSCIQPRSTNRCLAVK